MKIFKFNYVILWDKWDKIGSLVFFSAIYSAFSDILIPLFFQSQYLDILVF